MINRREALVRLGGMMATGWLTAGLSGGAAAADGLTTGTVAALPTTGLSGKSLSLAHITDIHLTKRFGAEAWFARCLHEIQSHPSKPSLILNTGDCVMDSLQVDRATADAQWKLWRGVLERELSLPMRQTLGNHDVFGLSTKPDSPVRNDPMFGKKLGLAGLELERAYYSFDYGDWHFIALDSIHVTEATTTLPGWTARLDDEQYEWLENDLKATAADRPVLVFSHVPVVQACSLRYSKPDKDGNNILSHLIMMSDSTKIVKLFEKHPNVKLCLSGHIHLRDRVELSGVTYICDGAVCGGWWKGDHMGVKPGYSLLTLHPDGKFDHTYVVYGWDDRYYGGKGAPS